MWCLSRIQTLSVVYFSLSSLLIKLSLTDKLSSGVVTHHSYNNIMNHDYTNTCEIVKFTTSPAPDSPNEVGKTSTSFLLTLTGSILIKLMYTELEDVR